MSNAFRPRRVGAGTLLQSGIPKRRPSANPASAYGVLLKGVVTATYIVDHENHPFAETAGAEPVAVYCDVLVYGRRWLFIRNCLVSQDRGAMHSGRIWKPRATSMTVTGDAVDLDKGTNPANMDGDHVLAGFVDGNFNQPVILCGLPHPAADAGNEEKPAGHRLKLKLADGDPDFFKHHGSAYGISDSGDFEVDTSFANDGSLQEGGKEQNPPTDGKGSHRYRLAKDAQRITELLDMSDPSAPSAVVTEKLQKLQWQLAMIEAAAVFQILIENAANTLKIEGKDAGAKLTLGDGTKSAAIVEALQSFWDTSVKPKLDAFDAHVHPTGVGPSGPPNPLIQLPAFDTAIISSKVKFPDG